MKSLLTALQEGRLIELPATDKAAALEYLANLIEAVPDIPRASGLYEAMMARERSMTTALGMGIACPHVRAPGGGELVCAVGWIPAGLDYGAPDGKRVHLVVMYYIPDSQKSAYLKEISALAAAMRRGEGIEPIASAEDIATVRERLLDWVAAALEASVPEGKARMIRLEARQAATEVAPAAGPVPTDLAVEAVLVVEQIGQPPLVLCRTPELAASLERHEGLSSVLQQRVQFDSGGWRLVPRNLMPYANGRALHELWAIRSAGGGAS